MLALIPGGSALKALGLFDQDPEAPMTFTQTRQTNEGGEPGDPLKRLLEGGQRQPMQQHRDYPLLHDPEMLMALIQELAAPNPP